jgi:hypothetical protein
MHSSPAVWRRRLHGPHPPLSISVSSASNQRFKTVWRSAGHPGTRGQCPQPQSALPVRPSLSADFDIRFIRMFGHTGRPKAPTAWLPPSLQAHLPANPPDTRPCPAHTRPCPAHTRPCPADTCPCPPDTRLCPADTRPCPADMCPCPPDTRLCPTDRRPCPTDRRPCPTDRRLCPADTRPCPTDRRLCPADTRLCPADTRPCPTDRRPCPADTRPCPTDRRLCPADTRPCPPDTRPNPADFRVPQGLGPVAKVAPLPVQACSRPKVLLASARAEVASRARTKALEYVCPRRLQSAGSSRTAPDSRGL